MIELIIDEMIEYYFWWCVYHYRIIIRPYQILSWIKQIDKNIVNYSAHCKDYLEDSKSLSMYYTRCPGSKFEMLNGDHSESKHPWPHIGKAKMVGWWNICLHFSQLFVYNFFKQKFQWQIYFGFIGTVFENANSL